MRNVVILWLQSWNTDVWFLFLFIRPVLAAVSTQGSSGIKSQIHCFGAGNSRPLAPFLSTRAIFPFALEPSVVRSGVWALSLFWHPKPWCVWVWATWHIFIQPNLSTSSGPQDKPPAFFCLFICTLFSSFPIVFYYGSVFFGGAGLGELVSQAPSNPAFRSDTFCRGELEYMGQSFYLFSCP